MSLYVAIDTATDLGSVAIGEPGSVQHEIAIPPRRHAAETMPAVAALLERAGMSWTDVAGLVLADGPGSFTGLRIGLGTAKGLLAARPHLKLHTVPSLLGAAWSVRHVAETVAAVYDALRDEVFLGLYAFSAQGIRAVIEPRLVSVDQMVSLPPPGVALGDGAVAHAGAVRDWCGRDPLLPSEGGARAGALLELMGIPGAVSVVDDVDRFEPAYGRRAAAQDR
ncbi:MAG: tRNA (adenosine(37)-N6)-threonylcarbamoyltransferase complex dimerization subunit type 1 TsaB, partial [Gemmatimonadales bacterium]|nr:tRNA (adenosine(37)-N6)-threonylcarbamoyltransferase complex dimerization subunit type 1 TsaB [Gemmatimonadales bacterium]